MKEKEVKSEEFIEDPGNIPLTINSYIDIFSSFDSRPFSEKALSIDFIEECKRASMDKENSKVQLIISIPRQKRVFSDEVQIKKRLREHFQKHFIAKEKELKKIKRRGVYWVLLGIIINVIVVSGFINFESNILHTILSIFEVPSWFLIWEGLGKIFIRSKEREPEHEFYAKMVNARIFFKDA